MKTNLSSQIKLDRIPKRYYSPKGEVELAALTRNEKIYTKILESSVEGAEYVALEIVDVINKYVAKSGRCIIAFGTGSIEAGIYSNLIKLNQKGEVDFSNVYAFNLTELYADGVLKTGSTICKLKEILLDKVNIPKDNIYTFDTSTGIADVHEMCQYYEATIDSLGGLDLVVCSLGETGSIAFNEPGSQVSSHCRLIYLGNQSRHNAVSDYSCEVAPKTAFTLGLRNINSAGRVICIAWGENYSDVVKKAIENKMSDTVPASFLQMHRHAKLVVDLPAAEKLTRISHPWEVTSCDWDDKLIRRAIVWLCELTGKPILKLTNKDYNDNGLGELLALFGSAYNVNIKIFNDLQHTITGWPGGKPNADDTFRPERANPYPKRVIVFSPHPDDDVISMGGTLKRLVVQNHDVHVAYQTSGNIAVGDEDMMRYIMVMDKLGSLFGIDTPSYKEKSDMIHAFIDKKNAGDVDSDDIRKLKGIIRQCEASTACNYIGVKKENVHFCALPFYETGKIKKGDLSRADVDIIKDLIQKVKPHQIFVAGDLADPHGTHRVCTDAVLAAVDECLDEDWMKDCRIWMYRGAWAEWEIDHIEMAVPISPEELRFKRNSILKHQSQMENAPFLGDDDRLFWQRAEERNKATAELYANLGLASYEAIEAFVEYVPIK
ncbi:MAG: PIG-L family deacetylase [Muribaculaceae bacterium]|nr:PIG-L family deacetylase [Muribaculaceae bacterium]